MIVAQQRVFLRLFFKRRLCRIWLFVAKVVVALGLSLPRLGGACRLALFVGPLRLQRFHSLQHCELCGRQSLNLLSVSLVLPCIVTIS